MMSRHVYDAIVVGSGPNGLAAAITLAQEGLSVVIFEAKSTIGGGMRSAELTLPGFIHDICSAIHPLGIASPFFRKLPLSQHELEWIHPLVPLAHPFDNGTTTLLERSIDLTSQHLNVDAAAYKKLMEPLVVDWDLLATDILAPLHLPRHPLVLGRFGLSGICSADGLAKRLFKSQHARALFAGLAAHSIMPLEWSITAAFGIVLGVLGHSVGWPISRGGSQKIAQALASIFQSLGGKIITNQKIENLADLPPARNY
jgi:phytoene dehydrogenase-like protein